VAGEKILIVDSNTELIGEVAEQTLAPHGFKPLLAYSQNEGVKLAVAKSPQLLLLHLSLDSMIQLLQRVAQTGRLIPAILMVEQASTVVPIELLRLGVQDYVAEPFTAEDILQAVRRVLGRETRSINYHELAEDLTEFNQNLEQRVKEFGKVLGSGGAAGSLEDLDSVLNRVIEAAVSITGADTGYLFVLDEKTEALRLRAAQNLSKNQADAFAVQLEDSTARSVARSGKPILLSGSSGQYLELKSNYPIKSLLNVPLKADDRVIGVLGVDNQTANTRFSLVDLRRLTELADMAAAAVINDRQYSEARQEVGRHIEEVATLQAIANQLSDVTDFNVGAQLALSLALKATNAEAGVLAWIEEGPRNPMRYIAQGHPSGFNLTEQTRNISERWWDEQILQEVIRSGQPALSYDLGHQRNGKSNGKRRNYSRSRLIVPMRRGNKVMGAINLESTLPNAFTQEDLQFVTSVADQMVVTLEGALLQEKAEAEHARFSLMMEAVDNGVWLVDADLRLMAQNEAATQMLGWSETEIMGRSACEFETINKDDSLPGLCQLLSQAIEKQQRIACNENILLTKKNGPPIPVKLKIVPVVREGKGMGAICAFHLSKRGDEHVRFEFANMASHLLRTPLTSIQTAVELLLSSELDVEEQRTMLDRLREQSQRMREFVKELVEMSRLEAGIVRVYAEPVALSPLIDRVLGLMRYEESNHNFSLTIAEAIPIVAADLAKTELILVNLLRSGVGRCPNGGDVNLEIEVEGDEVIISVTDNGEALPVGQLDRIFSQFYPVENSNGMVTSTYNLGLYSTKRLIELQNGRIWVESQPGKGSRISFSLPVWR
jgi:PAS domain S-box-containing protein